MAESRWLLLSHPLTPRTPAYGARDRFRSEPVSSIRRGDTANTSRWTLSTNHLGSHVDVPRHFFPRGKTVTDYAAGEWIFDRVLLLDVPCRSARLIGPSDLPRRIPARTQLLLLRTGSEKRRGSPAYWRDNPGLAPELGGWLRRFCPALQAVGLDFISATSWQHRSAGRESHRALLDPDGAGTPLRILEDLALARVAGPIRRVVVAPLLVAAADGAPVTVLAELAAPR